MNSCFSSKMKNSELSSQEKKEKKRKYSTILLIVVLQLQVFRRLSTIGYTIVLLAAYIYWFSSCLDSKKHALKFNGAVFLIYFLILPLTTVMLGEISDFKVAIIRYGAILPFLFICMIHTELIYKYLYDILFVYSIIVVISAILMIYQIPFGKISFFVDTAGRLGYERYGSLLGSTTTYGTFSLVAFMSIHNYKMFNKTIRFISEILIIIGGILCLSKAFFINFALTMGLMFIFHTEKRVIKLTLNKLLIFIVLGSIICVITFVLFKKTFVGEYFSNMINYTFSSNSLGTEADLKDRLTMRPLRAFEYHNMPYIYYCIIGVGFKGYSGVLGLSQYPMCHNNYFDIVLSQGLPALLSIISIYFTSFFCKYYNNKEACMIKQLVPYILINMLAGQWSYLSVGGILFFCIIYSVCNIERKENDGS